jgi:predicted Zn-dependent protease
MNQEEENIYSQEENFNTEEDMIDSEEDMNDSEDENTMDDEYEEYDQYDSTYPSKKLRIPIWVILFLIVILVLDAICMIQFPSVLNDYRKYKTAESRTNNGDTKETIQDLIQLSKEHPKSFPIIIKSFELMNENGYYDDAADYYNTYLAGELLSDSEYNQVDAYASRLEDYYTTYDAVDMILTSLTNGEIDNKEASKKLSDLLQQDGIEESLVYYFLAQMQEDAKNALDYMNLCYESDPECFDVRVQLSVMHRRLGQFDLATKYIEEAMEKEKKDSGALRSLAIIKLLQGEKVQGVKLAEEAYNVDPNGVYIKETYLIALTLNDEKDKAKQIKEEMKTTGETLEKDTKQLLNGKMTLEEYYLEKEA